MKVVEHKDYHQGDSCDIQMSLADHLGLYADPEGPKSLSYVPGVNKRAVFVVMEGEFSRTVFLRGHRWNIKDSRL